MKTPCVFIMANKANGTLYVGVTADLIKRVWQHKNNLSESFTRKYSIHMLVYFEQHELMIEAITREKQIKAWKRAWKIKLIFENNPKWQDLYPELL